MQKVNQKTSGNRLNPKTRQHAREVRQQNCWRITRSHGNLFIFNCFLLLFRYFSIKKYEKSNFSDKMSDEEQRIAEIESLASIFPDLLEETTDKQLVFKFDRDIGMTINLPEDYPSM